MNKKGISCDLTSKWCLVFNVHGQVLERLLKNSREIVSFVTAMDLHLPVLPINELLSRVLSCSLNSNFPVGNQLKFSSTESSKPPVKIKK